MPMHESTFNYLAPTDKQKEDMAIVRGKFMELYFGIDGFIPDGPDKTYMIRQLREVAMWANIAITRQADGSPRT
jgi:hypothetical protein